MSRRTLLKAALVVIFLSLTAIFVVAENVGCDTILILQSEDHSDAFARRVDIGLREAFGAKVTTTVRPHYMDSGMAPDRAGEAATGETAKALVERLRPTVLVTIGDDAQEYVAKQFAGRARPSIVFAGISGDIGRYGFRDKPNVTGVVASRPYGATRDLLLAANTFRPHHPITRIFHISADYEDYEYPDPKITQFDWRPMTLDGSVRVATLEDWQNAVRRAATTSDVIVVSIDEGMRRSARDPTIA